MIRLKSGSLTTTGSVNENMIEKLRKVCTKHSSIKLGDCRGIGSLKVEVVRKRLDSRSCNIVSDHESS